MTGVAAFLGFATTTEAQWSRQRRSGSYTTQALGEEGGNYTTQAVGEEGGRQWYPAPGSNYRYPTTYALGEEGGRYTTQALGEEGGSYTTQAVGEEGAAHGVPHPAAIPAIRPPMLSVKKVAGTRRKPCGKRAAIIANEMGFENLFLALGASVERRAY